MTDFKQYIREVQDWPKAGINFKDITTLLENRTALKELIDDLARPFIDLKTDKIVGIDARGFLLAAPMAYALGAGLSIVRKKGKLPYKTIRKEYSLEYASDIIEMHDDTILPGERVILVDDLCATGGTALAASELIEQLGGTIEGIVFAIDLPFLGGSRKLRERGYKIYAAVEYDAE